jgi:hypothetical protein
MILVGIDLGSFFSLSVLAQNVVPANRLGVSTAASRYLGRGGNVGHRNRRDSRQ